MYLIIFISPPLSPPTLSTTEPLIFPTQLLLLSYPLFIFLFYETQSSTVAQASPGTFYVAQYSPKFTVPSHLRRSHCLDYSHKPPCLADERSFLVFTSTFLWCIWKGLYWLCSLLGRSSLSDPCPKVLIFAPE